MHRLATFGVASFAVTVFGVGINLLNGQTSSLGLALTIFGLILLVVTGIAACVQLVRLWRKKAVAENEKPAIPVDTGGGPVGSIGQSDGETTQIINKGPKFTIKDSDFHYIRGARPGSAVLRNEGIVNDLDMSGNRVFGDADLISNAGTLNRPNVTFNELHGPGKRKKNTNKKRRER